MQDFSAIVSFALNVICTPDFELADRLTGARPGTHLSKYVRRVFDDLVWCQDEDIVHLVQFVNDLIGLERKSYLAAIQTIRTYVNGVHRLADDFALSYTLLVASIESLAQNFDGHRAEWEDYDERKRNVIDKALARADEETVISVREAILEIEHTALSRRFRDFAMAHISKSFFREEATEAVRPVRQADLRGTLQQAYNLRSGYIHALRDFPSNLSIAGISDADTVLVDRVTLLTFQGLARLTRHVITEFVRRQPKMKKENYDYWDEQSGILQVPLVDFDPNYWIHKVDGLTVDSGRERLEGFLSQVVACLRQEHDASVTDIQDMLSKTVKKFPNMNKEQRRPFLALIILFNELVPHDSQMDGISKVDKKYIEVIESPSPEAMLVNLLLNETPNWHLDEHEKVYREYLISYSKKSGLKVPPSLVAGCALEIAERHRASGNIERARKLVTSAVENYPGHEPLYILERTLDPDKPINWREIVFSSSDNAPDDRNDTEQEGVINDS